MKVTEDLKDKLFFTSDHHFYHEKSLSFVTDPSMILLI